MNVLDVGIRLRPAFTAVRTLPPLVGPDRV